MNTLLVPLHRWISIGLVAFWMLQVATGVVLVFHWELNNLSASIEKTSFDPEAIGARIEGIQAEVPGRRVSSVWTSGGTNEQFDIYVREPGAPSSDIWRVNAAGELLRVRRTTDIVSNGGIFDLLIGLHTELLAGPAGRWLVGISGIFLLINLVAGAKLAWPRRHRWGSVFRRLRTGSPVARSFAWHRMLGLGAVVPAMMIVGSGVLLSFEAQLEPWIIDKVETAPPTLENSLTDSAAQNMSPASAIEAAMGLYPKASLTALRLPTETRRAYQVFLRQPGEANKVYGATEIHVSAANGRAILVSDPLNSSADEAFMTLLFPVHTGQVLGLTGRLLSLVTGMGLLVLMVFGGLLFAARRRNPVRRAQ